MAMVTFLAQSVPVMIMLGLCTHKLSFPIFRVVGDKGDMGEDECPLVASLYSEPGPCHSPVLAFPVRLYFWLELPTGPTQEGLAHLQLGPIKPASLPVGTEQSLWPHPRLGWLLPGEHFSSREH